MKSIQQISQLCLGVALSTFALEGARANLLVYDPFDYDAGSPWTFQDGGQGFASSWEEVETGEPTDLDYVRPGSLSYGHLKTSGNSVFSVAPSITGASVVRDISNAAGSPGSTTWVSFLFSLETNTGAVGEFDSFSLSLASTSSAFNTIASVDMGVFKSGDDLYFGLAGSGAVLDLSSTPLVLGETYFLTASIEWDASGTNEVVRLYLNPSLDGGTPDPSSAIAVVSSQNLEETGANGLTGIAVNAYDFGTEWAFDELRIGQTFADVAPVTAPEPSAAMLVLGAMGMLQLARRKRISASAHLARAA